MKVSFSEHLKRIWNVNPINSLCFNLITHHFSFILLTMLRVRVPIEVDEETVQSGLSSQIVYWFKYPWGNIKIKIIRLWCITCSLYFWNAKCIINISKLKKVLSRNCPLFCFANRIVVYLSILRFSISNEN